MSSRDWLAPGLVFLGLALGFLLWMYHQAPASRKLRAALMLLKMLGLAALVFCLLEPLWSGQRAKPGQNQFIIVADNSESLQIHDRGRPESRGESLREILQGNRAAWQSRLSQDFQVRQYVFDSRLKSTTDFSDLTFDGRSSSLGAALRMLAELNHGRPVAGVLLFTDGNATDLPGNLPVIAGLPPVYPVIVGNDQTIRDVAITKVAVSQTAFEDAPVTIQASVSASGYSGARIQAQLFDRLGSLVDQQVQKAPRDDEIMAFPFEVRPTTGGLSFYRLHLSAMNETEPLANLQNATEATLANNTRLLAVDRGQGPYRVLYVSGRPNWEYKFMKRALDEDTQIQLVGLIRVANRERKFEFRGRRGESSNPLYRGFDQQDEMTERYDQPVLARLGTRDELELRGGFPRTAEELYRYHAVILDDLEAEFFTAEQQALLQKFVSERGGGLLMLGGLESFQQGRYQHTPIGSLLPVYLDPVPDAKLPSQFRLTLTREGWLQPWARLRNNESEEKKRLDSMPPFGVLNPVPAVKPGASVIATVSDAAGKTYPALVVERFGNGHTAALTIGDFWLWGLRSEELHRDMDKAWRQMVRWLVADVPNRIDLQIEQKPEDFHHAVHVQVRVRDPQFQPLDNAQVAVRIQRLVEGRFGTNTISLAAEPALNEPGLYQATYIPRETGAYQVDAAVTNAAGAEMGRTRTGWTTEMAAEEFRTLKPNRALLESLARQTGGEVVAMNALETFARSLPYRQVPITESWTTPLWHQPTVFLLVLACFIAEWGLRRWKGLP